MSLCDIADELVSDLSGLRFPRPVKYVYNPLDYARSVHHRYLQKFGRGRKEVVLVGMNPGPWGMAQTGVPFGEVSMVRGWLGLSGKVGSPQKEHPARRVEGFACRRSEVSGTRLWGWARDTFKSPEQFFSRFFIANYCPLLFLEESGRNATPDRIPARQRRTLESICDAALRRAILDLEPRLVVGVGQYAEQRSRAALEGLDVAVGRMLHPSPASPAANRNWSVRAAGQLRELGVDLP